MTTRVVTESEEEIEATEMKFASTIGIERDFVPQSEFNKVCSFYQSLVLLYDKFLSQALEHIVSREGRKRCIHVAVFLIVSI